MGIFAMGIELEREKFNRFQDAGTLITWYLDFIGDQQNWPSISETICLQADAPNHIGRAVTQNECAIVDARISRRHAMLEVTSKGLKLTDLKSVNGTFVNGIRILGEVYVVVGDKIAFDRIPFRVRRSLNIDDIILENLPHEQANAGLARKRLIKARQERLANEGKLLGVNVSTVGNAQAYQNRYLQSRYYAIKPIMMGSLLAVLVAGFILYWL